MTLLTKILIALFYALIWFILSYYLHKSRDFKLPESILQGFFWPLHLFLYIIFKFFDFVDERMEHKLFQDTESKEKHQKPPQDLED